MALKIIYTFFLGLLLALFVGMGINAFYPAPKYPELLRSYTEPKVLGPDGTITYSAEEKKAQAMQQQKETEFREASEVHSRTVSIITMIFATVFLIISLSATKKIDAISDGLLLGGVFLLFYSIGMGFASRNTQYQFVVVSVGLIIALILGYLRFAKDTSHISDKK